MKVCVEDRMLHDSEPYLLEMENPPLFPRVGDHLEIEGFLYLVDKVTIDYRAAMVRVEVYSRPE